MTKTADQVKGITTNTTGPVVIPKATNWDRKYMTHAQAVDDNRIRKEADNAAEEARIKVLKASGKAVNDKPAAPEKRSSDPLADLRQKFAEADAALKADPTNKKLQVKRAKLAEQLDEAEDAADGEGK